MVIMVMALFIDRVFTSRFGFIAVSLTGMRVSQLFPARYRRRLLCVCWCLLIFARLFGARSNILLYEVIFLEEDFVLKAIEHLIKGNKKNDILGDPLSWGSSVSAEAASGSPSHQSELS